MFSDSTTPYNYYDFRLLTSSSMPGNWIFVSDASDGCTNTQKIKYHYYKHIRYTVPQNGIPTAICTSKHAVLMIVCHISSHDSNWNSKPKIDLQWLLWTYTTFHIYSGCIPFFPIIFNTQSWKDIIWIILQTLLWSRANFFFLSILQNFCSCCSKYM